MRLTSRNRSRSTQMLHQREEFSKATKLQAWVRCKGHCEQCSAKLYPGKYEFHHIGECTFGGDADLSNCLVLCRNCHGGVTADRSVVIAKSNRQRAKHLGLRRKRSSFSTNKDQPWKRCMDGSTVRRDNTSDATAPSVDPETPPPRQGDQPTSTAPQLNPGWPPVPKLQTKRLFIRPMEAPSMTVLAALNNKEHMRF